MRLSKLHRVLILSIIVYAFLPVDKALAQAEVTAWGNITSLRIQGQPFNFETSICLVNKDWKSVVATALERQSPKFNRIGNTRIITTRLDSLYIVEKVVSLENGTANISIDYNAHQDLDINGLYFRINMDADEFGMELNVDGKMIDLGQVANTPGKSLEIRSGKLIIGSATKSLKIDLAHGFNVIVKRDLKTNRLQLYIPLKNGTIKNGEAGISKISLAVKGNVDSQPIAVIIDPAKQGRNFAGFGGNFRLQNPKTDSQVINYCLDKMRVAWGRVEMPFAQWQPDMDTDPITNAKQGKLNKHVEQSMLMAQKLQKLGIPIILTSWNAPNWAIIGEAHDHKPGGEWGNPLNPQNFQKAYKSISDYIIYLRDVYGVDVKLFSFNESDLGINIKVTPQEHDDLIKSLGAYFLTRGLKTKMLLGDNSDANSYSFIYPALNDLQARQYIGAISFHSWRGWETQTLNKWADAAKQANLPLIVGEGSIDAAAWAYPKIFEEESYARQEMNLYLRLLTICQPLSILQWQLTADYSPLIGGGIFGNNEPLHPGQRFYNLKQFASTPKDVFFIPATLQSANVTCAALGNSTTGAYALHFVNNGATRLVVVSGLPANLKSLNLFSTKENANMEKMIIPVVNGKASFTLTALCFASLLTSD